MRMSKVLDALRGIREELDLIQHRLDTIEDSIVEEMTRDDLKSLAAAMEEEARGETIPLEDARKLL